MTKGEKTSLFQAMIARNAEALAALEIGWWQAHHRRDRAKLVHYLSEQYMVQYGVSKAKALEAALAMLKAADWHDDAEKWEDFGDQKTADRMWAEARKYLVRGFKILLAAQLEVRTP